MRRNRRVCLPLIIIICCYWPVTVAVQSAVVWNVMAAVRSCRLWDVWVPDVNICALSGLIRALRGRPPLPAGLQSVQSRQLQPDQPVLHSSVILAWKTFVQLGVPVFFPTCDTYMNMSCVRVLTSPEFFSLVRPWFCFVWLHGSNNRNNRVSVSWFTSLNAMTTSLLTARTEFVLVIWLLTKLLILFLSETQWTHQFRSPTLSIQHRCNVLFQRNSTILKSW